MKCGTAERWIVESLDRSLDAARREALDRHCRDCPRCRRTRSEHELLRGRLRTLPPAEPRPYFWERLRTRLDAEERPAGLLDWQKWFQRAIPVSLFLIGLFIGGLLFLPGGDEALGQSEALLLRNSNPLTETSAILEESRDAADKAMIIFAASERTPERSPRP
jgi:anti-sigma factor RsiW